MAKFHRWKPFVVILAINFAMALLNILIKKVLAEGANQFVIITYRMVTATIFLTPIAYFFERRNGIKLTIPILGQVFFSALIGATLTQYLYLLGMQHTSAAFASAFVNMTPVMTFLLALLLRQEKVNLRSKGGVAKVLGPLVCIGGVTLLILYRGVPLNKATHSGKPLNSTNHSNMVSNGDSAKRWILGSVFLILSILLWAAWFLLQARIGKKYPCKYSSTALMSFFGAIQSAILCFSVNRDVSVWVLRDKLQISTVLSAGIIVSGLCYVGMSWCVEQKGPVFTSAFTPFIQIFTILLDLTFFHEQIYLGSVIGSILVVCGLYLLLWGKSCEAADDTISNKPTEAVGACNGSSATSLEFTQLASNTGCP